MMFSVKPLGAAFVCAIVSIPAPLSLAQQTHRPWLSSLPTTVPSSDAPVTLPSTVRVRIAHAKPSFSLDGTGPYDFMSLDGGKVQNASGALAVKITRKGIQVGRKVYGRDILVAPVRPSDHLILNGRRYRGALLFESVGGGKKIDVIDQLGLEEYLYGVLPREVGAEWPMDALKAQAVVSRTYALANMATDPDQRFDLTNGVSDQVYGGMEDESAATNQAVESTRGEVLVDSDGKPIQTFFHSSCGGRTETPQYVWASRAPEKDYATISDPYCKEDPFYHWELTLSGDSIRRRLRRAGIKVGEIKQIKISQKSPSGRAWYFLVVSSSGKREIQGNRFRIALGPETLRSTLLTDLDKTRHGFHFEGRGWGHGAGLCQWGARGRAKEGQNYREILAAYYSKVSLVQAAP